jgi:hypothetical protein
MNQSIYLLILSIAVLGVGWVWLARKNRRGSDKTKTEPIQPNESPTAGPTRSEEQITCTLEAVVQQGETESLVAIAAGPKEGAADSEPIASISEIGVAVEGKALQSGSNILPATPVTEAVTTAQPEHICLDANGPHSTKHTSSIEDSQIPVVSKNESATAPLGAPAPVLTEEESEAASETKQREPPKYPGLRPTPSSVRKNKHKSPTPRFPTNQDSELHVRVHLVFDRRGRGLQRLSLIPDWHRGMTANIEVTGTQGDLMFCRLGDSCQDVILSDIGTALRGGVVWHGKGLVTRWHWVLGGRELYVLAPGDDAGLCGFVSVPRLLLNLGAEHVVLATTERRAEVLAALTEAGCGEPVIMDETVEGVPAGWLLLRGVEPTRPVQSRDEADIMNALRPAAEIDPHFAGGIRLAGRTWVLGHPPRIRFTGDTSGEFEVKIDAESASVSPQGGYVAPGWDTEGRHSLWFAGRLRKYLLIRGTEHWNAWGAHDFGTGATICGPCTLPQSEACRYQVRVFVQNPVLVGAVPGQVFRCNLRADMRNDALLLYVPFAPVWALPVDDSHVNKRTARIVLAGSLQSVRRTQIKITGRSVNPAIAAWCAVIKGAGRKGLPLATEENGAAVLWREYRRAAKQLWRKMQ